MAFYETHEEQRFCWADLRTADTSAAKQFYGDLFGWEYDELLGTDETGLYYLATLDGLRVAGLAELTTPQIQSELPAYWNSYVCVKNLGDCLSRCMELGAATMMDIVEIANLGSMAMLREPDGASFSLWQPEEHFGLQVMHQSGSACRFELVSMKVEASIKFYGSAFGWQAETSDDEPAYTKLRRALPAEGEDLVGGMMAIQPDWGDVTPNWAEYFQVDSVDATLAKVLDLGGEALHEPIDISNERLLALRDPQGGVFALLEATGSQQGN